MRKSGISDEVADVVKRASAAGLRNVLGVRRDVAATGCGLPDRSADYVMLFNILHIETPLGLLREACRALASGGAAGYRLLACEPCDGRKRARVFNPTQRIQLENQIAKKKAPRTADLAASRVFGRSTVRYWNTIKHAPTAGTLDPTVSDAIR